MINHFYGIVDRRKEVSFISTQDVCRRSLSQTSDTPRAILGFVA